MIYLTIFILKFIENMISTLRLIIISNEKKLAGALLQFICSIVFIISASLVIVDFNDDIFKIIAFAVGCGAGSYVGCFIEEKIAIGTNMIICVSNQDDLSIKLRNLGYIVTSTLGSGLKETKHILFILIPRKGKKDLIVEIKKLDKNALIISENAIAIKKKF